MTRKLELHKAKKIQLFLITRFESPELSTLFRKVTYVRKILRWRNRVTKITDKQAMKLHRITILIIIISYLLTSLQIQSKTPITICKELRVKSVELHTNQVSKQAPLAIRSYLTHYSGKITRCHYTNCLFFIDLKGKVLFTTENYWIIEAGHSLRSVSHDSALSRHSPTEVNWWRNKESHSFFVEHFKS